MASIASGIPCPLIFSEPKRAIKPIIKLPTTGIATTARPTWASTISAGAADTLPNQNRLVATAMSFSRIHAPNAAPVPTTIAAPAISVLVFAGTG